MGFHVYPDPQLAPFTVSPGAASSPVIALTTASINAQGLIGPDNVNEPGVTPTLHPTTVFIRFAMSGMLPLPAPRPTVVIKLGAGTVTEINTAVGTPTTLLDPANASDTAYGIRYDPDANNVYVVKVLVAIPGSNWEIAMKNNAAAARTFTCVIAGSLTDSRQPWIDILPVPLPPGATTNYDAVPGQNPPPLVTLSVANYGTGPLTITDTVGTAVGGANFTINSVTTPINPNETKDLKVAFTPPTTIGVTNTAYLLNSSDNLALITAGHNRQIALSGTTHKLEVVLLVDASGSMAYKPDGGAVVPAPSDARWGKLKPAAKQFLDLLGTLGAGQGRFGVGMFPDITTGTVPAPSPSSVDIQTGTDIEVAAVTAAKNGLDAHTPVQHGGATPIGHGIGRAMGTTVASFGDFLGPDTPTDKPVTFNRRYLVLMSDGANNSGPPNPPEFYGTGLTSFKGKKIKVIAVGYGDPAVTAFEVDQTLLNTIATESDGQFLDAGVDDAGLALKKQFRTAISAGLSLDPTTDPGGVLTPGVPEVRRPVTITPYDTRVAFVVNWRTFNAERVSVTLQTPTCEVITPGSAQSDPNIFYSSHPTYAIYVFKHDYLRNASNPTNPRYGTWTLIITGNRIGATGESDSEPYDYEVLTDSRLKLTLTTDRETYYAGAPISLSAALTLDGKGITYAAVTLQLDAPGQSSDNWLAWNQVTAEEYRRAAERLSREDVTTIGIKSFALQLKHVSFNPSRQPSTIQMIDAANQGVYTTRVNQTSTPGTYEFYVTAVGQTEEGVAFRREKRLHVRVGVRPERQYTLFDIKYRRVREELIADIRVIPRDRFGNIVLVDLAASPIVELTVKGGEFIEPLVGHLDGSYSRSIRYTSRAVPAVGLTVAGKQVTAPQRVAQVDRLYYVDQVLAFNPGSEAEPGANRHRNPEAARGDFTRKDREEFVALGGYGSLTVGLRGHRIVAQKQQGDDVTVFVLSGEELRPYLVEALPAGGRDVWVALGVSPGVTQSFSLRKGGLAEAQAIRITDQSGRTLDNNFKPSASPGVRILAVGIKIIN